MGVEPVTGRRIAHTRAPLIALLLLRQDLVLRAPIAASQGSDLGRAVADG